MPLFDIPKRENKDKAIVEKLGKKKAPVTVRSNGLLSQITQINSTVDEYLGKYKDEYQLITTEEELQKYLSAIKKNGIYAIDTETTGLDPILDKIVGFSLYTPNEKAVYVPINHVSYITGDRISEQLTEAQAGRLLEELRYVDRSVMFNASFDIRVIKNQLGVKLTCWWDCYLASRLMNENEQHKGLKALHQKYILEDKEDEFRFESLFKGIVFDKIPIKTAYLYAAHDARITYELYEFQEHWVRLDHPRQDMRDIAWVFHNIEMPCVAVVAEMEDTGIELDINYAHELSERYTAQLQSVTERFYEVLNKYSSKIDSFVRTHENAKLDNPINIASASQIATLLYDILGVESVDKKFPRGTGEAILHKIAEQHQDGIDEVCNVLLEYREVSKLINTYIDKLPKCVNHKDGRIHCKFNQYGADTGRFSSSDPNLQNIPSHNKDIRKMFKATDGYVLMSSDFSQQEPKCLAALCRKQGDSQMYETFMQGKDLYSEIASKAFNKPYEECREFNADGTTNKAGKERRTQAKSILLGVLYGRGEASIGEQLGCSAEKAHSIKQSVFTGFPAIEKFEQDSLDMAWELGYVTTVCGRKRRLPDYQLPIYEVQWKDGAGPTDDILDFNDDSGRESDSVPDEVVDRYTRMLRNARPWDKRKIYERANKEGYWIIDNSTKIADAERQCVNARIQGSAADLTKLAMIELHNNERLKELGFRLLIPVHDEVIAECPEENMKECAELLAKTMSHAAEEILEMPIKCDVEITRNWYGESIV